MGLLITTQHIEVALRPVQVSSIASEFGIFLLGMMRAKSDPNWTGPRFPVSVNILIEGDFAAAAVMITMGALLGRVSSIALVFTAFAEVSLYALGLLAHVDVGRHGGTSRVDLAARLLVRLLDGCRVFPSAGGATRS